MFFISGMLSKRIFRHAEHNDRWHYIYDRFKRLMIPYFCVGILYMPFKLLLSRYANRPYDIANFWKIIFGENPDGGLWFLYALFLTQVLMGLILTKERMKAFVVISLICSFLLICFDIHFFRVSSAIYNTSFAACGLWFGCSASYQRNASLKHFFAVSLPFVIVICLFILTKNPYCKLFAGFWGSFTIVYLCKWLANGKWTWFKKPLMMFGDYTMDIYIFHGIIMVIVRILVYSVLGLNYYLCCGLMLVIGLLLPILISKYVVRPIPVFKRYLLGDYK